MAFCNNCGTELKEESKFCPECGTPVGSAETTQSQPAQPQPVQQDVFVYERKSKGGAMTLCFFGGWFGLHMFYLRKYLWGSLYLLFCWTFIPLLMSFGDFIAIWLLPEDKFHEKYDKRI